MMSIRFITVVLGNANIHAFFVESHVLVITTPTMMKWTQSKSNILKQAKS